MYVAITQSKKGLYEQAEKSFLAAKEYQEDLTAREQKQLEKQIAEANQAVVEKDSLYLSISEKRKSCSARVSRSRRGRVSKRFAKALILPNRNANKSSGRLRT